MPKKPTERSSRGMSLLELMVVIAILSVVVAGVTRAIVHIYRTQSVRGLNIRLQGEGRDALGRVVHVVRSASLGSPLGVIWTQAAAGGALIRRPAVQIYDNLAGPGLLGVKPGTDALLVVGAVPQGAEAAVVGTSFDSVTLPLAVTDTTPFTPGMTLLIGPYRSAAWDSVDRVVPGALDLHSTLNIFPDGKADSGSMVRQARSFLYFVNAKDELTELELLVPRPPATAAEAGERHLLARGVENLQLDCEVDDGVALQGCPATIAAADPLAAEAAIALGAWGVTGGPRINEGRISTVRTIILSVVLRSERPLTDSTGDPRITLEGTTLPVGGADDTRPYLRRAYRLPVAVRNVSLGAL